MSARSAEARRDRRAIHALEWIARSISFVALAGIALRNAVRCDTESVVSTIVVLAAALAYSILAFRLRMGQAAAGALPAEDVPRASPVAHPYRAPLTDHASTRSST